MIDEWGWRLLPASPRILLIGPIPCEKAYLAGIGETVSLDTRQYDGVDVVANISCCPEIESNSFDVVVAIAVLVHVADDEAAIREIHRLLKPRGSFFAQLGYQNTRETEALDNVSIHYQPEDLKRFNVGTFRKYGLVSGPRLLSRQFTVISDFARDPCTDHKCFIYACVKE